MGMRIALAQMRPLKGDIPANISKHKKLINLAISLQANAIFFPELSLTSYEPELANDLSTDQEDSRLDDFQTISNENDIAIGLGLPTENNSGINISMIIFQPDQPRLTYSKQLLPADELPYFVIGNQQILLDIAGKKIAPAICFESLQLEHSQNAAKLGAEIYLTSVAKSQKGVDKALGIYPQIAREHSMLVLMANCVGFCDNFESVGQSAIWTEDGMLAGQLGDENEGLLVFDTETEEVIKSISN